MKKDKSKFGIVLLNMGGPSSLKGVEPFLFSLFADPAIINLPGVFRIPLAKIMSLSRARKTKSIYAHLNGKSPIWGETIKQQQAVAEKLAKNNLQDIEVFICMRYTLPNAKELCKKLEKTDINKILLLPLYPHFSSTTTSSSIQDFIKHIDQVKIKNDLQIKAICCYPTLNNYINAHVLLITIAIEKLKNHKNFRILFSAHSLPEKIIEAGDPYQWQIMQSVQEIINNLPIETPDYKISYQSKVGPLKWLSPSTEDEIITAGKEKKSLIVVPISFVSEHSETLVELDIDYKLLAEKNSVEYIRVPTLSVNEFFVNSLVEMIEGYISLEINENISKQDGFYINNRICPRSFKMCPNNS